MNAAADLFIPSTGRRALRNLFALGLAALIAGACGGTNDGEDEPDPVCGDEEVNGSDQCDGADLGGATCESLGFARGTLACSAECGFDVAGCEQIDADQDGVTIFDEEALGLDPNNPDTDTDGFFDGHEIAEASDPLSLSSWPYLSGLWPHRLVYAQADGVQGAGWQVGQVIPNHMVTDQFGNPLQMHQFYGYKIVLSFGARWCNPCKQAALTSEAEVWTVLKEQGYMVVEVLVDGDQPGLPATLEDAGFWASFFGLTYPVTYGPSAPGIISIPTYYFINSDLTVGKVIEGYPTAGDSVLLSSAYALY
ncbi:MAG TPA: redoxin domain-containing protein [Polyangiaceae bacterium]|nr:redoxin domain-containing protein [Polyangiaceae bacterium]